MRAMMYSDLWAQFEQAFINSPEDPALVLLQIALDHSAHNALGQALLNFPDKYKDLEEHIMERIAGYAIATARIEKELL